MNETIVNEFLQTRFPDFYHVYYEKLNQFVELLWQENQKINLISRQMNKQEYWLAHIYDSLSLAAYIDLTGKEVLDFGSGGGLPGIPLNIVYPQSQMYLLDSTRKKMTAVEKMIKILDLKTCFTINSRLEELEEKQAGKFDVIVCRSVKMEAKYLPFLRKLLTKGGRIFLYKGKKLDDVELFKSFQIHHLNDAYLGERKIIEVRKKNV